MTTPGHDDVVRESFQRQVPLFSGPDSPFARRPASALGWLEPLETTMIVLDVACGAGHAAEQVAPSVRQVVGVDLTPELLTLGAERLAAADVTNVLLQEGNAAALPFVDASFDVVFCRSSLHHFAEPEGPLTEMARVCRPGGRVVISDLIAPVDAVRGSYDRVHRQLDPSHVAVLLEAEIAEQMERVVGPLSYAETPDPIVLPVELIFTEVADRMAVMSALQAELAGGPVTGFEPTVDEDRRILVSFTNTVVHATRR